jgi:hypothetical protein
VENVDVTQQPIFYLFIAFTILLSLGYSWGRRRNKRIHLSAFNALVEALNPQDQKFTTIGGLSGYHANLIPRKNSFIRRVDATITLLPRQSWLYMPFSWLSMRFDRLFITLLFSKRAQKLLSEGHLIERRYAGFRGPKISNAESLQKEEFRWDNQEFILYYADQEIRAHLLQLKAKLGSPGPLRHIAIVPEQEQGHIFMVPILGATARIFPIILKWFNSTLQAQNVKTR